jgi:hypothetical protein
MKADSPQNLGSLCLNVRCPILKIPLVFPKYTWYPPFLASQNANERSSDVTNEPED